jgi:hypothetical protein
VDGGLRPFGGAVIDGIDLGEYLTYSCV